MRDSRFFICTQGKFTGYWIGMGQLAVCTAIENGETNLDNGGIIVLNVGLDPFLLLKDGVTWYLIHYQDILKIS